VLPVEEHIRACCATISRPASALDRPMRDNCRVVLTGLFCEQPPLNLIKSLELAGCYVVDDDLLLVTRWLTRRADSRAIRWSTCPVPSCTTRSTSAKYEPEEKEKGKYLIEAVRRSGAEGVIFASPSFCDPALLDRPMLQHALKAADIPYIAFKYAENSGQMQPIASRPAPSPIPSSCGAEHDNNPTTRHHRAPSLESVERTPRWSSRRR
jgi:benzoyl-CoA reductase subunit C